MSEHSEKTYSIISLDSGNAGVTVRLAASDSPEVQTYLIKRRTMKSLGLHEGDTVDQEAVSRIFDDAELCRAEARTVKILSYSDHSCQALVRKLVSYGFSEEIARQAAQSAVDRGYIKETEQAAQCADYYIRHKYWGKKRIAMELISRGYGRKTVSEAIATISDALFEATIVKLVEKKYPEPAEDRAEHERRISAISRMGYSLSEIKKAMSAVYGENF